MKEVKRSGLARTFKRSLLFTPIPLLAAFGMANAAPEISDDIAVTAGVCGASVEEDQSAMMNYSSGESNDVRRKIGSIEDELGKVSNERPFIMIGDTDHSNKNLQSYLSSPKLLDSLEKAGIKKLYLEIPRAYQPLIDKASKGVSERQKLFDRFALSRLWESGENLEASINRDIDFIISAQNRGMEVVALDTQKNIDREVTGPGFAYLRSKASLHADICPDAAKITPTFNGYYRFSRAFEMGGVNDALEALHEARSDDRDNFEFIDTGNAKSAFIYGAAHFSSKNAGSYYSYLKDRVASVIFMGAGKTGFKMRLLNSNNDAVYYQVQEDDLTFEFDHDVPLAEEAQVATLENETDNAEAAAPQM